MTARLTMFSIALTGTVFLFASLMPLASAGVILLFLRPRAKQP